MLKLSLWSLSLVTVLDSPRDVSAFSLSRIQRVTRSSSTSSTSSTSSLLTLNAKRRKRESNDVGDGMSWYDKVDSDATPDDVFWDEMQRQRSFSAQSDASNMNGPGGDGSGDSANAIDPFGAMAASGMNMNGSGSGNSGNGNGNGNGDSNERGSMGMGSNINTAPPTKVGGLSDGLISNVPPGMEERATEKALSNYAAFMVDNNWLDEEYAKLMGVGNNLDMDLEEQMADLDRQIAEWEREGDGDDRSNSMAYGAATEPWDLWNSDGSNMPEESEVNRIINMDKAKSKVAKEFLVGSGTDYFDDDENESAAMEEEKFAANAEAEVLEKLSKIQLISPRLEKARGNPKAKEFFSRPPNEFEGFDVMWASAIDNACMANLSGAFRNFGVEFACNFGDWQNGCDEDGFRSIEDIASYKARMVYEITGLPTIASRTSFEVEPAKLAERDRMTPMNRGFQNTRMTSGYRFNDIGEQVDYVIEALKPYSEPTRITRFRSCFCFYDGEIETFDYGELDCDIYFSNSMRTYIPMSIGIDNIGKTLKLSFGFEFQGWLTRKVREIMAGSDSKVSMKLRDRILKEGKVLPNNIIDVSAFMDSMVDVNLMDECAKELSNRFESLHPTKILTIATTGLVLAIPMAKYLQVPVVYARKERNVVMSNTYQASYSSKTVGKNRELLVSKNHIDADDRILIVDDFLSSAASQEALLRIVSDAGSTAVGVGVLLEKSYDAGRKALSGFDIPVESVARIASVADGIIIMEEEEGFSSMSKEQ